MYNDKTRLLNLRCLQFKIRMDPRTLIRLMCVSVEHRDYSLSPAGLKEVLRFPANLTVSGAKEGRENRNRKSSSGPGTDCCSKRTRQPCRDVRHNLKLK